MVNLPFRFGDFEDTCQLCGEHKSRFGALVDPNGHLWRICTEDINALWDTNQALNVERRIEARAEEIAMERIRSKLFGEG